MRLLKLLLVVFFISTASAADISSVRGFSDHLPVYQQRNFSVITPRIQELAESAALHPDLIYFHLRFIVEDLQEHPNPDSLRSYKREYLRQRSKYQYDQRDWLLRMLQIARDSLATDLFATERLEELAWEIRSHKPVRFPAPRPLSLQERYDQQYYALMFVTQDFELQRMPVSALNTRMEQEQMDLIYEIAQDQTFLENLRKDDILGPLKPYRFLFDWNGDPEHGDEDLNIPVLMTQVMEKPVDLARSVKKSTRRFDNVLHIGNVRFYGGIEAVLPSVLVSIDREMYHQYSRSSYALEEMSALKGGGVNLGAFLKLREKNGLLSHMDMSLGFRKAASLSDQDQMINKEVSFQRVSEYYEVHETWDVSSAVSNIDLIQLTLGIQAPLWHFTDKLSLDLGARMDVSQLEYSHNYHLTDVVQDYLYYAGSEFEVIVREQGAIEESVSQNNQRIYGYLSLRDHSSDRIRASIDLTHKFELSLRMAFVF